MNLVIIFILIILFIIIIYINNLRKINDKLEILQTPPEPSFDTIQKILVEKLPTVFKGILYDCDPICDIFDLPIETIRQLSDPKSLHFKKLLTAFLAPYSLAFNNDWDYEFNETYKRKPTSIHARKTLNNIPDNLMPQCYTFVKEEHHRHFICQITGKQRIYLASPSQGKYIKDIFHKTFYHNSCYNNNFNFFNDEDRKKEGYKEIKYIEIILREGNMLYIPKGWYYIQDYEKDNNNNLNEKNNNDKSVSTLTDLEKEINNKNLTMDLYLITLFDLI